MLRAVDIFLDIDGPLIRDGQVTPRCFTFLRWAVESHRRHWLTTRDAHGTHEGILRALRHALGTPLLPREIAHLLCAVKPTRWRGSKLDAIDRPIGFGLMTTRFWPKSKPCAVAACSTGC